MSGDWFYAGCCDIVLCGFRYCGELSVVVDVDDLVGVLLGGRFAVWFAVIFACLGDLVLGGVKFLVPVCVR